jgi:DNA-binding transcriptional regulator PaaX
MQNLPVSSRDEWVHILRSTRMLPVTKLVGYLLAGYARADGQQAFPGQQQLATDVGRDVRRVRVALRSLAAAGLIECTDPPRAGRAAVYRLTKPRPPMSAPPRLEA